MSFWQKQGTQKTLIVVGLIAVNVVGNVFFGYGAFVFMFVTGLLSLFLCQPNECKFSCLLSPLFIIVSTLVAHYFIVSSEIGVVMVGHNHLVVSGLWYFFLFVAFLVGTLVGLASLIFGEQIEKI